MSDEKFIGTICSGIGTELMGLHETLGTNAASGALDTSRTFDERVDDIGLEIVHGLVCIGLKSLAKALGV